MLRAKREKEVYLRLDSVSFCVFILLTALLNPSTSYSIDRKDSQAVIDLILSKEKPKHEQSLLDIIEKELDKLNRFYRAFSSPTTELTPKVYEKNTDYLKAVKNQYLEKINLENRYVSVDGYFRYNTKNIFQDDASYPYFFTGSVGIRVPIFREGYLTAERNKTLYRNLINILNLQVHYPIEEVLQLRQKSSDLWYFNHTVLLSSYLSFQDKLNIMIDRLSKYDKYYLYIKRLIHIEKSLESIIYNDKREVDNLNVYKLCYIDGDKVRDILLDRKRYIIGKLNLVGVDFDTAELFKDRLIGVKTDFLFSYNNRKGYGPYSNLDFFSVEMSFSIPTNYNYTAYKSLERNRIFEEKRKVIENIYRVETDILEELLNFYQSYYSFKSSVANAKVRLMELEKNITLVRLGLKSLDLEAVFFDIKRIYTELQSINTHYTKILSSYEKIILLLQNFHGSEVIDICKVEE